jgi:DNA-binding response OmpR family regulator
MTSLAGMRVLVIEDEALIAAVVEDMLTELGATVIGPAATVAQGRVLAQSETSDAAVLDGNLRSESLDPIVAKLNALQVPFVFATGYGQAGVPKAAGAPVIEKPYTRDVLASALARVARPRA